MVVHGISRKFALVFDAVSVNGSVTKSQFELRGITIAQFLVRMVVEEERDVFDAKYGTWRTTMKDCEEGVLVEASCPDTASDLVRKTHGAKEILGVQIHCH